MKYSAADFQHANPPRIMGSETEYTTGAVPYDGRFDRFLPDYGKYRELSRDDGFELWLQNGARFYLDTGGLLEYATPECQSADEVAVYEQAGERIVQEFATNAAQHMNGEGGEGPAVADAVYKRSGYAEIKLGRSVVLEEKSAGHHESYLTPLSSVEGPLKNRLYSNLALSSFLASRAIWAGGGMVTQKGFEFSQKGHGITFGNSSGKRTEYGQKPAFIQDGTDALHRLEVRLGDGNMDPEITLRKFAVTSLLLRLIEHGDFPRSLLLSGLQLDRSFTQAARNLPVVLNSGDMIQPAEHQRRLMQAALDYIGEMDDVPSEEIEAAYEVREICSVINDLPPDLAGASQLADSVDWAAKLTFMRDRGIEPVVDKSLRAVMIDLKWEDIAKDGIARKWYREQKKHDVDTAAITAATIVPPSTRAQARTELLESHPQTPKHINWSKIDFDKANGGDYYFLKDPYSTTASTWQ